MSALVWFRSDLRTDDNTALDHALREHNQVAAVFYATPQQWAEHAMAAVRGEFIWRNLAELRAMLAQINVPLVVRVVPRFADIAADLTQLISEIGCRAVYANREYAINEVRRDAAIAHTLAALDISWRLFEDATLLPPGSVRTQQAQPFKVFTPFKRVLIELVGDGVIDCVAVTRTAAPWFAAPALPPYPYFSSTIDTAQWPAGEARSRAAPARIYARGFARLQSAPRFPCGFRHQQFVAVPRAGSDFGAALRGGCARREWRAVAGR